MSNRKRPASLSVRDALKARVQRRQPYDIFHTDPAEFQAALREALTTKRLASADLHDAAGKVRPGKQASIDAADRAILLAEESIAACRTRIWLRALSDPELERLEQEFPDEKADDFELELLAASADAGLSAAEWRATFAGAGTDGEIDPGLVWSRADRIELLALSQNVQRLRSSSGFPVG